MDSYISTALDFLEKTPCPRAHRGLRPGGVAGCTTNQDCAAVGTTGGECTPFMGNCGVFQGTVSGLWNLLGSVQPHCTTNFACLTYDIV